MVAALIKEIELQKMYLKNQSVETIYFGGGTPSLLSKAQLQDVLTKIRDTFEVQESAELTLEANPDDINEQYLTSLKQVGINRLSIGIQSFDNEVLQWMNRGHDGIQARTCVDIVRKMGFNNFNIDLIFGVPHAGYNLKKDLDLALEIEPPHISTYNLTIEPKTVFGHQLAQAIFEETTEEQAAQQYEQIINQLVEYGYLHYEVSNFALPHMESKHNRSYWQRKPYLGIGPSAHSFDGVSRQFNVAHNMKYLKALEQDHVPFDAELLTDSQIINELLMMGLRTSEGVDLQYLQEQYDHNLLSTNKKYITELTSSNFAVIDEKKLILTAKGKLIADRIASDLFLTHD